MSLEVGIIGGIVEALAPVADPEVIAEAVNDYLEEHPEATCPIDDTAGEGDTGKVWSADKAAEEVATLTEAIENILVYSSDTESATITSVENITTFKNGADHELNMSFSDGVLTLTTKDNGETNPYIYKSSYTLGEKKWIVGFKYKITKLNPDIGDPSSVRVILGTGNTNRFDEEPVWDEWAYFAKILTFDMTRLYFTVRGFATAPGLNGLQIQMKDMYIYDATGLSSEMCDYIVSQQGTNYTDGQVTYNIGEMGYYPDTTLSEEGKAADSKAVGTAISKVRLNVKEHGVKGDGQTDDTSAINTLFETHQGAFYFPAGTYKISGTITLPSESEMYGDGDQTVIDMYSCDNLQEEIFYENSKVLPYILVNDKNVKLHDFKIIGNDVTHEERHAAVAVLNTSNCVISDLTIYNVNFNGTQTEPDCNGYGICVDFSDFVTVERCHATRCGYECIGIVYSCNHCVVRDNYTKNGWRTCIQVHYNCKHITIDNNYMEQDNDRYDACFTMHGLSDQYIEDLKIVNNTMICKQDGQHQYGYCATAQLMSCVDGLLFQGNKIYGGKRALFIFSDSRNVKIIGNDMNCNSNSDYGVYIASYNTIVIGNRLENESATPVNQISNNPVLIGNIGIS